MCFVKYFVGTYFVFALNLANGQDVLESSSGPLDTARKDPIFVVSTASMPEKVELNEGQEHATETVSMGYDPITDVNPIKSHDLSDYQNDTKLNELSTKSNEVVEISSSVINKVSGDSSDEKSFQTYDVNGMGYEISEAPTITSEYEDDSKKENPIETTVSLPELVIVNRTSSTDTEKMKMPQQSAVTEVVTGLLLKCYSCSSERNPICVRNPVNEIHCSVRQGQTQNGCFALVRANSNITTRGCIADLTDEGLKYCKTSKLCDICYDSGCNKLKMSTSSGLANLHSKSKFTIFAVVIVRLINHFN